MLDEDVVGEKQSGAQPSEQEQTKFICGVIEGFYGRPWTTEQRKDLFRKLKKWGGMQSYVYAPKDDYKHRAYWRELYTVEEADHLSSLIAAAKEHNVTFYYALSPGLDMSYSSQKEIQTLKRKLDQVSQFGCEAFALLFDDIESELSKADKEVFQTFANAQVSVTNEIYTHLGNPKFLFCPTQYCSSRADPTVHDSEYLNTLGSKLNNDINIMWTGDKVISKNISIESIQEITEVLRRPPVIWDNLHANDYDQKRVYLGPYNGRSPELIQHLRGVMTNPNCEFHANTIAIHTLAMWSKCNTDSKLNSSVSADIKLETENEDGISTEELPIDCLSKSVYHPRTALKTAISEWLDDFFVEREAFGPITKPQPQVTTVIPIIPILPSINTCMTLTTTTTTTTTTANSIVAVPEVNTTQLQALADVCSTVNAVSALNPISNPVMNSLVSPTKVVTNDDILNPIPGIASNIELPKKIPISIVSVPIMDTKVDPDHDIHKVEPNNEAAGKIDDEQMSPLLAKDGHNGPPVQQSELADATAAEPCSLNNVDGEEDVPIEEATNSAALSIDGVAMLDDNLSPVIEPMECSSSLTSQTSPKEGGGDRKAVSEDVVMQDTVSVNENLMQVEESLESFPNSNADMKEADEVSDEKLTPAGNKICVEDLHLLCDLFYLPFEHGSRGLKLLNEFNWLNANANVLINHHHPDGVNDKDKKSTAKPEVVEWYERAEVFSNLCNSVLELVSKLANCANKEICHDLFSYVWDIAGALTLLNAFVKWLSLGHFPANVYTYTQGSFTWFSKGWKEAFMSGDQEPWVFRGGLIADLQRLMPVDAGTDLFLYKLPEHPVSEHYQLRPFSPLDESEVYIICTRSMLDGIKAVDHKPDETGDAGDKTLQVLPQMLHELIADFTVGPYINISPQFCCVAHDASNSIVGYACAALDVTMMIRNLEVCWIPAMQEKYSKSLLDEVAADASGQPWAANKPLHELIAQMLEEVHNYQNECPAEVTTSYPAVMTAAVMSHSLAEGYDWTGYIAKRLLTVTMASLRANACFGVHVRLAGNDSHQTQYYTKLGFTEICRDALTNHVYLGRRF